MKCSICIATYNKPDYLAQVLQSVYAQSVPFEFEVIVVDDGSACSIANVCQPYPVRCLRIDRPAIYRNPSVARNVAYRAAQGEVIIAQSDDVLHDSKDTIRRLVEELRPGTFVIATVVNVDKDLRPYADRFGRGYGDKLLIYTSPTRNRRPLFFLGSLYRSDLYAVGGNDEDFVDPSGEDKWFADCLMQGLELAPYYSDVRGLHLHHSHTTDYQAVARSQELYQSKLRAALRDDCWTASGGAWKYVESVLPEPSVG